MPYKVNPDGSIVAETADEAILLSQKFTSKSRAAPPAPWPLPAPPPQGPAAVAAPEQRQDAEVDPERARLALKLLQSIKSVGREGLGTAGMMEALGADKPKGLGSKTAIVNALLQGYGFTPTAVYVGARTRHGKVFTAGRKIDEAIAACEKEVARAR
jgi:hypothetical protein